jgi:hypothetical protein
VLRDNIEHLKVENGRLKERAAQLSKELAEARQLLHSAAIEFFVKDIQRDAIRGVIAVRLISSPIPKLSILTEHDADSILFSINSISLPSTSSLEWSFPSHVAQTRRRNELAARVTGQQRVHIEAAVRQSRAQGKCNPTSIPFDSIPFQLSVRLRHSCRRPGGVHSSLRVQPGASATGEIGVCRVGGAKRPLSSHA